MEPNRSEQIKPSIFIISPNNLQNELLKNYLQEKTGVDCTTFTDPESLSSVKSKTNCQILYLFDAQNTDLSNIEELFLQNNPGVGKWMFALYNTDSQMGIERQALERGIHGIFYIEDGLESLAKGARTILDGEIWFSRKVMTECLQSHPQNHAIHTDGSYNLTQREKEVLLKVISGASNQTIADDLFISPHTVKTHIYNLYKKIKVKNRLQATLWAAKYL